MGFLDTIKKALRGWLIEEFRGRSPSDDYPEQTRLFEVAITRSLESGVDSVWVTFEASGPRGKEIVQVVGTIISTCEDRVDVFSLLRREDREDLASRVSPVEECMCDLNGGTPRELAVVVDAIVREHYGLGKGYAVKARVEP